MQNYCENFKSRCDSPYRARAPPDTDWPENLSSSYFRRIRSLKWNYVPEQYEQIYTRPALLERGIGKGFLGKTLLRFILPKKED